MDLGTLRRSLRRRPLPGGGLYFLRGSPRRSEIHWTAACDRSSVDTRAIWDRLVSHLRLSATALSGTVPSAAAFAYLSAISLPGTSWWAGTHRVCVCVCNLLFINRYKRPESRLDSGKVGAACAWRTPEGWTGRLIHLGCNKEVFDAEVVVVISFLIPRSLLLLSHFYLFQVQKGACNQ